MNKISLTFPNHGKEPRSVSKYYSNHGGRAGSFSRTRAPAVQGLIYGII
jgi:hypothetical protein